MLIMIKFGLILKTTLFEFKNHLLVAITMVVVVVL